MVKKIKVLLVCVMILSMILKNADILAASKPKLNKSAVSIDVGKTAQLKVVSAKGKKIAWSTQNSSIAKVTSKGKVTGVGTGMTYIYAKVDGKKLKCVVKVSPVHLYSLDIFRSATWSDGYSRWKSYYDCLGNYFPNTIIITYDGADGCNDNSLEYYLGKKYSEISGKIAFSKENVKEAGSLSMVIYGDDKILYESNAFSERTEPETFSIDISGVTFLKFTAVIRNGSANDESWYNDLLLVDPVLK